MRSFKKFAACYLSLLLAFSPTAYAETGGEPDLRPIQIEVTDSGGHPVSGLDLSIRSADGEAYITGRDASLYLRPITDRDGRYEAVGHEAGRSYTVTLSNPFARPQLEQTRTFKLEKGSGPYTLQLSWNKELPEESLDKMKNKLLLRFVDETGAPVNNLSLSGGRDTFLSVFPEKSFPAIGAPLTDYQLDGRFILPSPEVGSYTVIAQRPDVSDPQYFSVPYAGGTREYTLPLLKNPLDQKNAPVSEKQPMQNISVRVIDAAGNAVPDVVVSAEILRYENRHITSEDIALHNLQPLRARKAGRDGIYQNWAAPYATYTLTVKNNLLSPTYAQKHELPIHSGLHTVVFEGEPPLTTLDKMEQKTILFFSRSEGEPAAGLQVTVQRADTREEVSDGWTDYEGKYLLLRAEPAQYVLTAFDQTGKWYHYEIDTSPGGDLRFTFTLPE